MNLELEPLQQIEFNKAYVRKLMARNHEQTREGKQLFEKIQEQSDSRLPMPWHVQTVNPAKVVKNLNFFKSFAALLELLLDMCELQRTDLNTDSKDAIGWAKLQFDMQEAVANMTKANDKAAMQAVNQLKLQLQGPIPELSLPIGWESKQVKTRPKSSIKKLI